MTNRYVPAQVVEVSEEVTLAILDFYYGNGDYYYGEKE